MKYLPATLMLLVLYDNAHACGHSLEGTWKSDGPATMAFARENARLQPETEDFLGALVGHMTLTFGKDELHLLMPDIEVLVAGERRPFVGLDEQKPYSMLFCNDSTVVWSARRPFGTTDEATTFHFDGPDSVWVYAGSTVPGVPDLHVREYFQRVR